MESQADQRRIELIVCDVLKDEVAALCRQLGREQPGELLEMGLHDQPDTLRQTLQERIDAVAARGEADAIALVYGRCGNGAVGLTAPAEIPLVIPRAHDCVTIFMGDRRLYDEFQRANPGSYFYTPGWQREQRVPGPDRLEKLRIEYADRFEDEDDVEFLLESEKALWAHYNQVAYVELPRAGTCEDCDYAKRCADFLGWGFERIEGDPALLRDLVAGNWDPKRFLVVPPGKKIRACEAGEIMKVSS